MSFPCTSCSTATACVGALPPGTSVSTEEINKIPFPCGYSTHTVDGVLIDVYRPTNLTGKNPMTIVIPGRNGSAAEYIRQCTSLFEATQTLGVCIDFSGLTAFEFEGGNLFPASSFDATTSLLPDQTFNPPEQWTLNYVLIANRFIVETWPASNPDYFLYGDDASSSFVNYFLFFFPLIEFPGKRPPLKTISGISSYYFFPLGRGLMLESYIPCYNTDTTATQYYPELIDYSTIDPRSFPRISHGELDNGSALDVYYSFQSRFLKVFADAVNPALKDSCDRRIYRRPDPAEPPYLFPQGVGNLPLDAEQLRACQASHCSARNCFLFFTNDTNLYGGVTPEGKNIPSLNSPGQAALQGSFRLFRCMNSFFSTKIWSKKQKLCFRWEYACIPACGHNSNFVSKTALLAHALDPRLVRNEAFFPQFFYFLDPKNFPPITD
ncbi:hypothetical protein EBZ80_02125 [bacterium]|nr:hypothetical protein [bacterium]